MKMQNQDEVVRQCVIVANNHGTEVGAALQAFIGAAGAEAVAVASERLRAALVAQTAGFDSSNEAATSEARRAAAAEALKAWDAPDPESIWIVERVWEDGDGPRAKLMLGCERIDLSMMELARRALELPRSWAAIFDAAKAQHSAHRFRASRLG